MSMTFTKLFSSITESTIWVAPDPHRLCWITMLAMADAYGRVWGSVPGLANRARISVEDTREALASFMGPDPDSRTKAHEGRRIEEIDGGWRLLNHAKYRAIRDEEAIKETKRRYINARRARERGEVEPTVDNVDICRSQSNAVDRSRPIAEAYTEAEEEADAIPGGAPPVPPKPPSTGSSSGKPARKRAVRPDTAAVWASYSQAYAEKYSTQPVRNAKVNGQIAQFVQRLGADEAPGVARAYVASRNGLYVSAKHCVDLMLRDAEKLRTEWATGNVGHQRDAREEDRLASTASMWRMVADELIVKGIK